ncbi:MAG: glycosyltransferase family 39 protein, partial [Chitinophagales bacterium]
MNSTAPQKVIHLLITRVFIPAVLIIGATARIFTWWQNRSLLIDEANLARNFCEKRWSEFFSPLSYDQFAPPLFSVTCKLVTRIFGNTEFSLRAFPLLCGLMSLLLFFHIARQLISNNWILLITVWIFSFSEMQLRYSTECKQYICDVTVALFIVAYIIWQSKHDFNARFAAILGIVIPWLSMPALFILTGAGIVFLRNAWAANDRRAIIRVSVVGALWLLNFAIYYLIVIR